MRVIHIYASNLTSVSLGGLATDIREFIKYRDDETEVLLVGVTNDIRDKIGGWDKRKIGDKEFVFLPLFYTPKSNITYSGGVPLNAKFLWSLWLNKHNFLDKKCILLIHRLELGLPFLIFRKRFPVVINIHGIGKDIEFATRHPLFNKKWFRWLYYKIEAFVIRKADKVILVSHEGMNYYPAKFPKHKEKFMFIPTSVDMELFKPLNKDMVRTKYCFQSDDKILLFVGRFDQQKGLDLLIEAFKKLKETGTDYKLVLVGEGSEKEHLQKKCQEMQIEGVEFKGLIEHEKLPEMMNCADIFVLTSLWEGMPNVVTEALACGIPVVSTDVGHLSEVIKEGLTGYLVTNRDLNEVKKKIILALQSSKDMKEKCRETARRFSSSVIVKQLENVCREVYQKRYKDIQDK